MRTAIAKILFLISLASLKPFQNSTTITSRKCSYFHYQMIVVLFLFLFYFIDSIKPDKHMKNHDYPGYDVRPTRLRLGMTREQFGRLLGVSSVTVVRWETGRQKVHHFSQLMIDAFRVDDLSSNAWKILDNQGPIATLQFLWGNPF